MPPSSNKIYGNNYSGKGRGRYLKPEAKLWIRDFQIWSLKNSGKLNEAKARISNLPPRTYLGLHRLYHFNWESLYYKNNKLRRMDTENREKLLSDQLALALGCDDSLFKESSNRTRINPFPNEAEHINITLSFDVILSDL